MIGKLILTLLHARTAAHVLHLKSRSYSEHVALGEFYEEIGELADTLAETYQGEYGFIEFPGTAYRTPATALDLLDDTRETLDECAAKGWDVEDTHLNNICDEIRQLIGRTSYKLRFLK